MQRKPRSSILSAEVNWDRISYLLDPESKFYKKLNLDPKRQVIFSSSSSLRGFYACHFFSKNMLNFSCSDGSWSLN